MKYAEESDEVTLSADEAALIFSFLPPTDILRARVCTTWRDAAKQTTVPPSKFEVDDMKSYNAMRVMSTALPNLQQLTIYDFVDGASKYVDGEDSHELISSPNFVFQTYEYNINLVSNFSKLRKLSVLSDAPLNGRYPTLFNFPLLQELVITECALLNVDFNMFARLTSLRKLDLRTMLHLTGNLGSLKVLKDTLEIINIHNCENVRGNFMVLANFPHLKELILWYTRDVTGDIRDIDEHDFPAMENLCLPHTVVGGIRYKFQRISDVPEFVQSIHPLLKRPSNPFGKGYEWYVSNKNAPWYLSSDSPDYYDSAGPPHPPFCVEFIHAGSRLGWSWVSPRHSFETGSHRCEINWLDPEPSSQCTSYTEEIQRIEHERDTHFYKGFTEPPTEEEYRLLCALSSGGNAYHL